MLPGWSSSELILLFVRSVGQICTGSLARSLSRATVRTPTDIDCESWARTSDIPVNSRTLYLLSYLASMFQVTRSVETVYHRVPTVFT